MSNSKRIDVLFVCVHNAGRSVAAKVMFNDRSRKLGSDLRAESAGTAPAGSINPRMRRVLEAFKLDASNEKPELLTDVMLDGNPRVVTMGCQIDAASCPSLNLDDVEDWDLEDPARMTDDEAIVSLVHEIARRTNALLYQLGAR